MKKLSSLVKKICNLKPSTYFILTYIIFFILQFVLYPKMLKSNFIYAEDGGVFTSDELRFGPGSLFIPYGGYLVMLSRIFGIITIGLAKLFNSFNVVPHALTILGALFVSFVASYFASDRFEFFIKGRLKRFFTSGIIIIMFSQFIGVMFNAVGIHWWCGFFIFLVSLELLNNTLPSKFVYLFICLSILSSPSALIIAFAALYFIIKKIKDGQVKTLFNKKHLLFFIMIFACLALQAYFMLFRTSVQTLSNTTSFGHIIGSGMRTYEYSLCSPFFIFSIDFWKGLMTIPGIHVIGGLLWIVILFCAKKKGLLKYAVFALVCTAFIYFMVFYKRNSDMIWLKTVSLHFYHLMPSGLVFLIAVAVYFKFTKKEHKVMTALILVILAFQFYNIRWKPDYRNNLELREANEYVDFSSKTYAVVKTAPYNENDWWTYTRIPVRTEYCEMEGKVCETFDD